MENEIKVAVNWWAEQLLNQDDKHDNGDALQSSFANFIARRLIPISEEQVKVFKQKLAARLLNRYKDHWYEEEPDRGSSLRVLSVDYHPCKDLYESAEEAGIDNIDSRFPIKTIMWVNPKNVKVACGYRSKIVEIF